MIRRDLGDIIPSNKLLGKGKVVSIREALLPAPLLSVSYPPGALTASLPPACMASLRHEGADFQPAALPD